MTNIFLETLAPNFFHVDKLPDYGLKIFENELGREIRRYTEDTGYKTELKIQYNGLRSDEVKALTAFYLQVKGTFDKFTLPINFYRSPSSITNSLTDLADTTEWRFMNPPIIQTVISNIYTVEIRLLSLKESLNPDSSKIIGFVDNVNVDFILPTILIPQQNQVTELVPIALEFIVSSIDLNQSVSVNSIDLTLETSELTFTTSSGTVDSRSIQSLSLYFVASQTSFGTLNSFEQMPSIIVSGTFTSLERYTHLVNTASGVASTTLPSNAPDDTTIIYSDYAGTSTSSPTGFGLNAFTLNAPVGQTIQGQSSRVLNVENTSIQVIKKGNRWTIVGTELATVSGGGGSAIPTVVINSNTTGASNTRYLCNTSGGSFTLTLPASPSNNDVIEVADFSNSSLVTGFGIYPLIVVANTGHTISGQTQVVLDRGGQGLELVFHSNRWSITSGIGENNAVGLETNTLKYNGFLYYWNYDKEVTTNKTDEISLLTMTGSAMTRFGFNLSNKILYGLRVNGSESVSVPNNSNFQLTGDFEIMMGVYCFNTSNSATGFAGNFSTSGNWNGWMLNHFAGQGFRLSSGHTGNAQGLDAVQNVNLVANTPYLLNGFYRHSDRTIGMSVNRSAFNTRQLLGDARTNNNDFRIGNVFGWSLANNWGIVFCGISRRLLTDNERDYIYNSGVWNMRGESKIVEILPVYLADIQAMLVASF